MKYVRLFCGVVFASIGVQMMGSSYPSAADVQRFIQEHPRSVILFQRNGCPYCAYVRPLFDAVRKKYADSPGLVAFLSVEVTADLYNLIKFFNFSTVPTFVYIKDGAELIQYRHGSDNKRLQQSDIEALIEAIYI
jgi:thiol-disulfide isomerase/thioredoxin